MPDMYKEPITERIITENIGRKVMVKCGCCGLCVVKIVGVDKTDYGCQACTRSYPC